MRCAQEHAGSCPCSQLALIQPLGAPDPLRQLPLKQRLQHKCPQAARSTVTPQRAPLRHPMYQPRQTGPGVKKGKKGNSGNCDLNSHLKIPNHNSGRSHHRPRALHPLLFQIPKNGVWSTQRSHANPEAQAHPTTRKLHRPPTNVLDEPRQTQLPSSPARITRLLTSSKR